MILIFDVFILIRIHIQNLAKKLVWYFQSPVNKEKVEKVANLFNHYSIVIVLETEASFWV